MLAAWRFVARRLLLGLADRFITAAPVRWIWASPSREELVGALTEFRPADRETVREMMAGRYLFAARLVDTRGETPFALRVEDTAWNNELRGFSWLRHFRDARDPQDRQFARRLVLDWIEREGQFNRRGWAPGVCARRVMNWLRHYSLLIDGADLDDVRRISTSIATQIQSLKVRANLIADPLEQLLTAIALAGVALCDERRNSELARRVQRLARLINRDIGKDGLHLSRSARLELQLLVELETLRQALVRDREEYGHAMNRIVDGMHRAFDGVSLSTGEPAYFNGTGQLPHDVVVAVQVQSPVRFRSGGTVGGYGRLRFGRSIVIADSGVVPSPGYAAEMHAAALAFEFSRGPELIVGNCGPAPSDLGDNGLVFRQGITHSGIMINAVSAARLPTGGLLARRLRPRGRPPELVVNTDEQSVILRSFAYQPRFRTVIERRLMLIDEGNTLVGQDRLIGGRKGPKRRPNTAVARFHLALGTTIQHAGDDTLRLRMASGALWTFVWENAELSVEDSVRQSAYLGFRRTKQIVLRAPLGGEREIAWVFSLAEEPVPLQLRLAPPRRS